MFEENYEKLLYILLIALMIFILGVQTGIHHGRELQKQDNLQEYYDNLSSN